jgi:hypothetical protein
LQLVSPLEEGGVVAISFMAVGSLVQAIHSVYLTLAIAVGV